MMQMENSKQFNDVLTLGKRLVAELDLEQSVDTLGRWMAHHISELILNAEKAKGKKKAEIEDRCRNAVLALWKHIEVLPGSTRPFDDVAPLIATLKALSPNENTYHYQADALEAADKSKLSKEEKDWLSLSRELDYSARILISMCLESAAKATRDKNAEWISLSKNAFEDELPIIRIILELDGEPENVEQKEEGQKKSKIELLENRRDRLNNMVQLAELLASEMSEEIESLKK